MTEFGILSENDDVELLEGWITQKMARNPPHDCAVGKSARLLTRVLPLPWIVRVQSAITTPDSEPEPDIAAVPGPDDAYATRHPLASEVGLLIEVADSSLGHDRDEKGRLYARAAIPHYWIINLQDRWVEVYSDPTGPDPSPHYRLRHDFRPGDVLPVILSGQTIADIAVNDLLPVP
jgi:Uma2 family endonuclease